MNIKKVIENGTEIAVVHSDEVCISDGQSALDFIMSVHYETGCRSIVLNKAAIIEDFFVLSTKIAGDVLQKVINYQFDFAVVGNFSGYTSQSLRDFIYESNKGGRILFVPSQQEAVERLGRA